MNDTAMTFIPFIGLSLVKIQLPKASSTTALSILEAAAISLVRSCRDCGLSLLSHDPALMTLSGPLVSDEL
jgi:hypothetical protein